MLGLVHYQTGRHAQAVELLRAAIAIEPRQPAAHSNLALALNALRSYADALAACDRALALAPDFADAHNNRGMALLSLQRPADALASVDRALALRRDHLDALNNRSVALFELRRFDDALANDDRLIGLAPRLVGAHHRRGNTLAALDRDEEAVASYDRALEIVPALVDAWINRGVALRKLGRADEALASSDRALALRPNDVDALNNRGNALIDLGRTTDALASYDAALARQPEHVRALVNRAEALMKLRRVSAALESCERALALAPDHEVALATRADALYVLKRYDDAATAYARLLERVPDFPYASGALLHCRLQGCEWEGVDAQTAKINHAVARGERATLPYPFLVVSTSKATQLQCARTHVADRYPPSPPLWNGERYRHERIRIAYLSTDLNEHAIAYLTAGLFEAHDRQSFEVTAISFAPESPGPLGARLRAAFEHYVDAREMADRNVASLLREREIDIAVDLNGLTGGNRTAILAHRPAPLQVNYLGYPGTMGAGYVDYLIADRHLIPPGDETHYAEQVVRLPDTYQPNDARRAIADATPTRAALGLPEEGFVFCCFNNSFKIGPGMFDVWMRLLRNVPGSVLWLLADNPVAARNLRGHARHRDVAPERLVFAPRVGVADHLARHRAADLFIDTLPYTAHTTASDALWAGLPLVTCVGETFAGRVAASLLNAVGLPELIAQRAEDYEALALALATTPAQLAAIRAQLATNRASLPLFDTVRYCRHLENAYRTMWERQQRGLPPVAFDVD